MKIALCGKMCSGKSYVSKYLTQKGYQRYGFGDAVKKYCIEIFLMKYKNRKLLQNFAQKIKEIDNDVWINYLDSEIEKADTCNILVDDLRFLNEFNYLKKKKFLIIKLEIDNQLQIQRLKKTYTETYQEHIERINDISESFIDKIEADHVIKINKNNENQVIDYINNILSTGSSAHEACPTASSASTASAAAAAVVVVVLMLVVRPILSVLILV